MRRLGGVVTVAAIMLMSASVFAQDGETRTKFYNFDDMLIDGQLKTPDLLRQGARDKAKFNRLLELKKSFLPKIRETAEERTLQ